MSGERHYIKNVASLSHICRNFVFRTANQLESMEIILDLHTLALELAGGVQQCR
jgi:hypothetical protein